MSRDFNKKLGERIRLRGPRGGSCTLTLPNGIEMKHPPATNGTIELTLDQEGEWWYEWSDEGPNGSIYVDDEPFQVADSDPSSVPSRPRIDVGRIEAS